MARESSATEKVDSESPLERLRKLLSWVATSVFAISFAALLVLSATDYWQPENRVIILCDRAWRISGATALTLGAIPILRRSLIWLAEFFGLRS